MKRLWNTKWFFLFAVALFLCVISLGVQLSYGAYSRRSYVKAVAATNETEKLFGSNLLYGVKNQPNLENDNWMSVSPYTVADTSQKSITMPLKIYNYLAEDEERVNQLDVRYIISFKVTGTPSVKADGSLDGYSVNGYPILSMETVYLGSRGLTTVKIDAEKQILAGRIPATNEYRLTLPGTDVGKVSFVVVAERVSNMDDTNIYGTDLLYLAARVVPSQPSTVQTARVTGYFADAGSGDPSQYAAYNYIMEFTGATTQVELKWDPELLELDPFFADKFATENSPVTPDTIHGKVIFDMEPGITKVQFYRKADIAGKTWDDLKVSVQTKNGA